MELRTRPSLIFRFAATVVLATSLCALPPRTMAGTNSSHADSRPARTSNSRLKFNFGPGPVAKGHTQILPTTIYTKELGYGFEPGAQVTCVGGSDRGARRSDSCRSDEPFFFSVAVPEGNYRVSVTVGAATADSVTTVKAELRRLMLERIETPAGGFATRTFVINVRTPRIEGGGEVRLKDRERTTEMWAWDEKLTLEFGGVRPSVSALEITRADDLPTIYLLGDSTVADQPLEPYNSWGQMLTRFFGPGVAVANHAESGESLKSSLAARRLDKVLSTVKPGDYLIIQYGHNDEKERGEGVGAFTTYKTDLKHFVAEARRRGATPVLVTPVQRRTFDPAGKITNSHGDYPAAVRQAAEEERVPLIDLHLMSTFFYEALGPEKSKLAFKEGDGTHHNNYGSYQLAKCIVEGVKLNRLGVAKHLAKDVTSFDPRRPDPLESFRIPASPLRTKLKPLGN